MAVSKETLIRFTYRKLRFVELDLLRGFAIIGMVFLHILWDLDFFGILPLNRGIYQFQEIVPSIFFVLMGICLVITVNRRNTVSPRVLSKHLLFRGLWILGLGMIISLVTLIFIPDRPIFFGVLHCIGLSVILSIPLLRFKSYNIIFAAIIILAGIVIGFYPMENPTLAHLIVGIHQADVGKYTIDYFPLLPWFGVSLIGVALGNWLYKDGKRRFAFPDLSRYKPVALFSWLGKHSLTIYLIHQPIIYGLLRYLPQWLPQLPQWL